MRTQLLTLFFLTFAGTLFAQDIAKSKTIPTTYDRSSFAVFYIDNSSQNHWNEVRPLIDSIVFSDKYDNNNFNNIIISSSTAGQLPTKGTQDALLNELNSMNIGRQLIAKWYNRQPDGTMNMDLIHKRGRFSVTDADFLKAQTSKRGNAALEDFGNRLINLSHILVIDLQNVKTTKEAKMENMKGWQATAVGYLFRLDFNEEKQNELYDNWIYDDDTEDVKKQKRAAFDNIVFSFNPLAIQIASVSAIQLESSSGIRLALKAKTMEQLLKEMVQKSYDEVIYKTEMKVEDLKVKTPLYETRPLRAKIGLKEGLKTDYRFFVYEHVYNPKTNEAEPKRRGVIRVAGKSSIVDNRKEATGDMGTSKFYQVAGRKLEAGFTLQQQNDFGLELIVGGEGGNTSGLLLRADFRLGRFIGIPAFYLYGEFGGFDSKEYQGEKSSFMRYGAGLAKGFQLGRNLEIRPYFGFGLDNTTDEGIGSTISSLYIKPGVNLALNLRHNIQLVGGLGAYSFIGEVTDASGYTVAGSWDDLYDKSGPSALFGVKFMF